MPLLSATRPSTVARAMEDQSGLFPYVASTTLKTIHDNRDLYSRLAIINGDWRAYKELFEECERRGGKREASAGTNVHLALNALANGHSIELVPDEVRNDALGIWDFLKQKHWRIRVSEMFVVTEGLKEVCAGTFDLMLEAPSGALMIADIKTVNESDGGKYRAMGWAIQMAIYARGKPYLDKYERDQWGRPRIDLTRVRNWVTAPKVDYGVVIQCVRGKGRNGISAIWVDLNEGWLNAHRCMDIREARKVGASLAQVEPQWL